MRTKKQLLNTKFKLVSTGKIFIINDVQELEHGNHKISLINENDTNDSLKIYLDDLLDRRFFKSLSNPGLPPIFPENQWKESLMAELVSEICMRMERMYYVYEVREGKKRKFISDEHFFSPPKKEENFKFGTTLYEVVSVTHVYGDREPGEIYLKKIK
ncbi:hypothetical protein EG359_22450 (plasmid) [Chryseobacterium joostei]|uniref:Uncharacterized protein n=1 Tax=Chryseobacterium joostei TaxID=112234 RepID=A0A1N7KHR3_9FLAO|nr:hypothetical protein [Chryseobacterium joostei]AZB02422.1 hypothetical protein EG359_22450 [Chryseobacterium joostei]SIS61020.1 hypothetical protein SAMN05421768_11240 [Chryseobacterium joostei]